MPASRRREPFKGSVAGRSEDRIDLGAPEEETHFAAYHYRVITYKFCPGAGRYLLVDQFMTRRKFASLDDEDHPGNRVLNIMMPQVKKRLLQQRDAGEQFCTK